MYLLEMHWELHAVCYAVTNIITLTVGGALMFFS